MSVYKELLYEGDISRVKGVQFCIMSPEDIVKRSVVEVFRNVAYSGNEPEPNGLFDARMGVVDHGKVCRTCEQKTEFCPGHFGHIVLAKPVFHVHFLDIVKRLMRCVCFFCSNVLVNLDAPEVRAVQRRTCSNNHKRFDAMHKLCSKVKVCPCCNRKQPDRINKDERLKMRLEWRDSDNVPSQEMVMSAEDVHRMFKRITEEHAEGLGFSRKFNRPEWLICSVLPVPPPAVRPSVRNDTGQRSEDDLTHILSDIVKFNQILKSKIEKGATYESIEMHTLILQYHVATLVDNSVPTMYTTSKDRTGRQLRTIVDRLKGKEGRIRCNLMGKRVDFSARTVITPDPNLSIDELGVPLQIAMNLTEPAIVRKENLAEMQTYVKNGPDVYPGAKHVRKAREGMRTIRLRGNNAAVEAELEVGDVVERHLMDGDYVLFNRQPSLHKMSMMAHRVRVMPGKSFRLNVCVCSSYNADFDGDEMNMHITQSLQTHEEIKHLAAVSLHVISPRHSKPIIGIEQDSPVGVFRLTQEATRLSRIQFMNLTCSNPMYHCVLPPPLEEGTDEELMSGRQLMSTIIPSNTNLNNLVRDGVVMGGPLDKKSYSTRSTGLVHSIYNDKGPDALVMFLNNTQKLICDWLVLKGFSVGVSDLVLDASTQEKLDEMDSNMRRKVFDLVQDVHNGRLENKSTVDDAEFFEKKINDIMSALNNQVQTTSKESFTVQNNRMLNMIQSGSKGTIINFQQMVASVGQQVVDSMRVTDGFESRTLPHFTKFDDGPVARGFVANSFIGGLAPHEFFFHSMGGRVGLIDTAVRSVAWDTEVVIADMYTGVCARVPLGEWVDALMAEAGDGHIKHYPEEMNMELLDLDADEEKDGQMAYYIPTVDGEGVTSWGKLTAVTRHDPGATVYKVRTMGNREVTVADSESLLVWDSEAGCFEKMQTRDVKVGMMLPAAAYMPPLECVENEDGTGFGSGLDLMDGVARKGSELFGGKDLDIYGMVRDVCLDAVVEIEPLAGSGVLHGKLYDVTVPSTLNFVLANGLGVRDTSETGYIQRKLVKSMEDCKVHHDMSVRNAAGHVVQFVYGEDGADAAKLEYQKPPYLDDAMDDEAFRDTYLVSHTEELRPYLQSEPLERMRELEREGGEFQRRMLEHFQQLKRDWRYIVVHVHGKEFQAERTVLYPVHVQRIVENTAQLMDKYRVGAHHTDLDPITVLDRIAELEKELVIGREHGGAFMFGVLLRCFLAPKQLIFKHRLSKLAFDRVTQVIRATFYASLAQPGEAVGITAAQSIGEPTTQLSVVSSARILIGWHHKPGPEEESMEGDQIHSGSIGQFIDDILVKNPENVVDLGGSSVVMDLPPGNDFHIVGVSDDEKTSWRRISQISRHPANGGLVRIHTKSGKSTCATLSHSFLKRTTNGVAPVKGGDLKLGDRVPVARKLPVVADPQDWIMIGGAPYKMTRELGWFFGAYLADGSISTNTITITKAVPEYTEFRDKLRDIVQNIFKKDVTEREKHHVRSHILHGWDMSNYTGMSSNIYHPELAAFLVEEFRKGSFQKRVPEFVYASNLDFIRGVIGGYFDGDGNVGLGTGKSTVRSASVSEELTEDFILLLAYVGIFACKCREKHIKEAARNDLHTVQVLRRHAPKFKEEIGFVVKSKAEALDALVDYVQREDAHSTKEETDMIPQLGDTIAAVGKALKLEGQSRLYGRFTKKEAIGRATLLKFISTFEDAYVTKQGDLQERLHENNCKLNALKDLARDSIPDARKVIKLPVENGKMIAELGSSVKRSSGLAQWAKLEVIGLPTLQRIITDVDKANKDAYDADMAALSSVPENIAVLRQAAYSDVVWDEIVHLEHLEDPGEMVYDFTVPGNDSFMVDCGILVHNTLNSVHYDEELLLCVDGKLERVSIGDFTHRIMDAAKPADKEKHERDTELTWIRDLDVKVLSGDEDGKVAWQTVEAVTRHPVVNVDGSDTLLHVCTRTGREVTATKGKSFLKRVNNKVVAINGSDLHVGDRIPVSTVLPTREVAPVDYLEVSNYLPPSEWIYMSQVQAALALQSTGYKYWTRQAQEQGIVLPYNRSDSFLVAFVGTPGKPASRRDNCLPGNVYPAHISKCDTVAHIPERIPLDEDFGWLVGAYLAEGCIAVGANKKGAANRPYALLICNMQPEFRHRFERFCDRYSIGYHVDAGTRLMKSGNRSPTVSLRMHNLLLGELFMRMFGNGAANKRVPPELFGASDKFLLALLDGYWSGDGHVHKEGNMMSAYSANGAMLIDIQQIMTRFGIMTSLHQMSEQIYHHNVERFDTTVRGWNLYVPACGCARFREVVTLCVAAKRQRLDDKEIYNTHAIYDIVPDIELSTGIHQKVRRAQIPFMLQGAETEEDRQILQRVLDETIFYDEVVSIEEVPNTGHDRVYDLTVTNTRNFNLLNGLVLADTFHLSGHASASGGLTHGVPRLRELFHVSREIKTPEMRVFCLPEFSADMSKNTEVMNSIQTTFFRELVKSSCVYFDPKDTPDDTRIPADRDVLRMHAAYSDLPGVSCDKRKSPWLLRFEFDRSMMLEKQVYFSDIHFALEQRFQDTVFCIFSDDNSDQLVCRVRLVLPENIDRNDILTEIMALEHVILDDTVIKGVKGIRKAVLNQATRNNMVYDDVAGEFRNKQEWSILTAGSNMIDVMANPYIDYTRVYTNNVTEVQAVLGIEAARFALLEEIKKVMWSSDSNNVNFRHMALLVDTMTNRGHLVSIDRHGIKKGDIGPLAKCSFEETDEMLIKAGVFCETDKINGVSANIMLGQVAPCGTGEGDMLMDVDAIMDVEPSDIKNNRELRPDHDKHQDFLSALDDEGGVPASSSVHLPEVNKRLAEKEEDEIVVV